MTKETTMMPRPALSERLIRAESAMDIQPMDRPREVFIVRRHARREPLAFRSRVR